MEGRQAEQTSDGDSQHGASQYGTLEMRNKTEEQDFRRVHGEMVKVCNSCKTLNESKIHVCLFSITTRGTMG